MNNFSNILRIPTFSEYFTSFVTRLTNRIKEVDPSADVPQFTIERRDDTDMDVEVVFGVIAKNEENLYQVKRLNNITRDDTTFIVEVNILEFSSERIQEFVSVLCEKCYSSYQTKDFSKDELANNKFACKKCKQECILYYNVSMIARETPFSNQLIKLYLSTYDNEGVRYILK
jgi:hypothetical protein